VWEVKSDYYRERGSDIEDVDAYCLLLAWLSGDYNGKLTNFEFFFKYSINYSLF
jgi:hypothetical protein